MSLPSRPHGISRAATRLLAHGLLACAGLGALAAQAQTVTLGERQAARVDNRQERQDARIDQGVASGELTRPEQARMEAQQAEADVLAARANLAKGDLDLGFTRIRSPITGRAGEVLDHAAGQGLLLLQAGPDVMRLAPSLIIPEADIQEALVRLRRALERLVK